MDSIIEVVKERLREFDLSELEDLDEKTRLRLVEIENLIQETQLIKMRHVEEVKKLKINISYISNSKKTSFTRKTLNNNPLLLEYVKKSMDSLNEEDDIFNLKRLKRMQDKLDDYESHNKKILRNIVAGKKSELECVKLEKEISILVKKINYLKQDNKDKDDIISNLRDRIDKGKLSNVKKMR